MCFYSERFEKLAAQLDSVYALVIFVVIFLWAQDYYEDEGLYLWFLWTQVLV